MAFITRKITRTSQPQELVGIDRGNQICSGLAAAALPKATIGDGKHEVSGQLYGTDMKLSAGTHGIGVDGRVSSKNSFRLHSVSNQFNTVWESPNTACTFATVLVRAGNQVAGNAPIFLNASPTKTPYSAWGIIDAGGTGTNIVIEVSAGGVNRHLNTYVPIENYVTHVLSGRYDGTHVAAFKNGKKLSEMAASGPLTYPSTADRGPSIGNFYDYPTSNRSFIGIVYLAVLWDRALSDTEISSFYVNPWQIFEPIEETIWIPDGVSVTLPTLVQPASTTSAGTWTPVGAATLHEAIDEVTPSDADYISVAAASTCEMVLAESAFPTGNVSLAYRALSGPSSTLTVTLKQGATTIMTRTHALTGTATLYTHPLTAGEVAAIVAGPIACTLTSS